MHSIILRNKSSVHNKCKWDEEAEWNGSELERALCIHSIRGLNPTNACVTAHMGETPASDWQSLRQ